ncbi:MAG: hypothetical protein C4547_09690, partial [Phycisphaerales bacterium]
MDTSAFHLYVTDPGVGKVYRYPLSCMGPRCQPNRVISGLSVPYDVQVSEDDSLVYALEQGGRVKRINLDGTAT